MDLITINYIEQLVTVTLTKRVMKEYEYVN